VPVTTRDHIERALVERQLRLVELEEARLVTIWERQRQQVCLPVSHSLSRVVVVLSEFCDMIQSSPFLSLISLTPRVSQLRLTIDDTERLVVERRTAVAGLQGALEDAVRPTLLFLITCLSVFLLSSLCVSLSISVLLSSPLMCGLHRCVGAGDEAVHPATRCCRSCSSCWSANRPSGRACWYGRERHKHGERETEMNEGGRRE
jgi:hypothetical protein